MSLLPSQACMRELRCCSSSTATERLCAAFWAWRLERSPEFATFCGAHARDDRLDDTSVAAYEKRAVRARVRGCVGTGWTDLCVTRESLQFSSSTPTSGDKLKNLVKLALLFP